MICVSLNIHLKLNSGNTPGLYTHASHRKQPAHSAIQKRILTQDAQHQTKEANAAHFNSETPSSTRGVPRAFHFQGTKILPS